MMRQAKNPREPASVSVVKLSRKFIWLNIPTFTGSFFYDDHIRRGTGDRFKKYLSI